MECDNNFFQQIKQHFDSEIVLLKKEIELLKAERDKVNTTLFGGTNIDEPGLLSITRSHRENVMDLKESNTEILKVQAKHSKAIWMAAGGLAVLDIVLKLVGK